jgi:predicted nucleic acid-binding protein
MRNSFAVVLLLAACACAQDSTQLFKQVRALYAELPKSTYDLEMVEARDSIRDGLEQILRLKNVHIEDEPAVAGALALAAHGIDFADALHLASRPAGSQFVTFDRAFLRRAKRAGIARVVEA